MFTPARCELTVINEGGATIGAMGVVKPARLMLADSERI
jgi:hypothetical protein